MKIIYHNKKCIDCTNDPHFVNYELIEEMLDDIVLVCENEIVQNIELVELDEYESDWYSNTDLNETTKQATGQFAEKHKTEKLYLYADAHVPKDKHLPPGLTGVREAIKMVRDNPEKFNTLSIGVIWKFAGDSSCSDYITAEFKQLTVDYSNQDWWISKEGYIEHCQKLGELLGVEIETTKK